MSESKGRPSRIFETERIEEFLQLIQDGVDFNVAADSSRFARSTVFEWLKKGREIQQNPSVPTELNDDERQAVEALQHASTTSPRERIIQLATSVKRSS